MAHLWIRDVGEATWAVAPLSGGAYGVSAEGPSPLENPNLGRDQPDPSALLVRRDNGSLEQWLLLARAGTRISVNGQPLILGVRLLCDRDEITVRADGSPAAFDCFFSTERLAQVVPYPGGDAAVCCPRCKQPLEQGQMAVRCPNAECGAWYHEDRHLPCWTYAERCALCEQRTELGAGFRWTPEHL